MVSCYKKIAAYLSEVKVYPNIPDLGDLAITHAIVSVNKLFKLFKESNVLVLAYIESKKSQIFIIA
jgi:hypothetical protein